MSIAVSCQIAPSVPRSRPDIEAVDPDQLARPLDLDMALGAGIARRLIRRGVAGDQPKPLGARVEPVTAEHLPDAGEMRLRWTAAGMLVAEQQFRQIIGYRDLAELVNAIERHTILAAQPNPDRIEVAEPVTVRPPTNRDRRRSSTTIRTSSGEPVTEQVGLRFGVHGTVGSRGCEHPACRSRRAVASGKVDA